jgi:hypothetical protein
MNDNSAVLFAYAVSALAEIEACKLQNEIDKECGRPITYLPSHFEAIQHNLESLTRDLR